MLADSTSLAARSTARYCVRVAAASATLMQTPLAGLLKLAPRSRRSRLKRDVERKAAKAQSLEEFQESLDMFECAWVASKDADTITAVLTGHADRWSKNAFNNALNKR